MDLAPDFDEFCGLLSAHGAEYVIVGAHALAFHGAPRFTGDLDILVRPTEENGRRVLAAISDFGFPTAPLAAADFLGTTKIVQMGVVPVQIHVMSAIDGVTWDEVSQGSEAGPFGGREVRFIGREAFIRNKRAAGRVKDLADIDALRDPEL